MTTRLESDIRRELHRLAEKPGPTDMADRALLGARRTRRQRAVLTIVTAVLFVSGGAIPLFVGNGSVADVSAGTPSTAPPAAACKRATDEATPPQGAHPSTWPDFVNTVIARLPARNDYAVQFAYGICYQLDGSPTTTQTPNARALINLGPNRENGHVTVELFHELFAGGLTCTTRPASADQVLFCEDATATTPMVIASTDAQSLAMLAVYQDGRAILMEAKATPFDVDALRAVVTDHDLAALVS